MVSFANSENSCSNSRTSTISVKRLEKLNEQLKEELSKIILREMDFSNETLVTITRVETSDTKLACRVFISILAPGDEAEDEILSELIRRSGFIQRILNRRLRIRPVPKIRFLIDTEEKKRERIEKLLSEIQ